MVIEEARRNQISISNPHTFLQQLSPIGADLLDLTKMEDFLRFKALVVRPRLKAVPEVSPKTDIRAFFRDIVLRIEVMIALIYRGRSAVCRRGNAINLFSCP